MIIKTDLTPAGLAALTTFLASDDNLIPCDGRAGYFDNCWMSVEKPFPYAKLLQAKREQTARCELYTVSLNVIQRIARGNNWEKDNERVPNSYRDALATILDQGVPWSLEH